MYLSVVKMLVNASIVEGNLPHITALLTMTEGTAGFEHFCGGELWNTSWVWETEDPEVSRCLQVTLLAWLPAGLLLLLTPWEVRTWLASPHPSIPPTSLNITKILAGLGLVGLCVARLVRLERDSAEPSDAEYLGLAVILLSYLLSTLLLVFSLRY